jgi:hypothetical protein
MAKSLTRNQSMPQLDDTAFPASPAEAAGNAALRDGTRKLVTERLDDMLPAYLKE